MFRSSKQERQASPEIFLYRESIDFRMGMNRLSEAVSLVMQENPLSGSLYVFINRRKKGIKVLYWDRNGFCLWQKRLEKEHFHWPTHFISEGKIVLTSQQFQWLIEGFNLRHWKPHAEEKYEKIV